MMLDGIGDVMEVGIGNVMEEKVKDVVEGEDRYAVEERVDGGDGWRRWMEEREGVSRGMDEGAGGLRRGRCLIQQVDNK